MSYKNIISALSEMSNLVNKVVIALKVREREEEMQKREKTVKMIGFQHCSFTALYTTKKYGCSGLKDNSECLSCEFRR